MKLKREGQTSDTETYSDDNGQFTFSNVAPGSFQLTITSEGLASRDFSGTLNPGESYHTPLIMLMIATQVTEVHVGLTADELADVQIQEQVHQRVLGFIPIFTSAMFPMQLLSLRNTSSSLPGDRLPTPSHLPGLAC